MYLTSVQTIIMILAIAAGTMITRFIPFLLFPENKKIPDFVMYLGKVLPCSMMGLLVVYCFKDTIIFSSPFGIPEIIAIVGILIIHKWKRNVLLSIAGGTGIYMFLVQVVF